MKKRQKGKEEQAKRAAVLEEKAAAYVAKMEDAGKGINFDRVQADRLLIVEALNDWSAGTLAGGGNVRFTHSGADPTCATVAELREILGRAHQNPVLLYPVTGFLLSTDADDLRYQQFEATYRLMPHSDGSRASAIKVAEAKHVSDTEACYRLWLFCATEDCVAYLEHQMDAYGLNLMEQEDTDVRRLISGFLQEQFSLGQVWNAIWRSVRHAAALSKRQYFNNAKAAKTIPKHIDKVLTQALGDPSFHAYGRPVATPMGAVLMLFRKRFGIGDAMTGLRVREALAADANLAPAQEEDSDADYAQADEAPERVLLQGTFYFYKQYTEFDRIALSCIDDLRLEQEAPQWDDAGQLGYVKFTAPNLYGFNGRAFFQAVRELLGIDPPNEDEVAQRVICAQGDQWARATAYRALTCEALIDAGVGADAA